MRRVLLFGLLILIVGLWGQPLARGAEKPPRAKIRVSGLGLLGNLELRKQLRLVQRGQKSEATLNANQIEDLVLLTFSYLQEDGYLEPKVEAQLTLPDHTVRTFVWDNQFDTQLPRSLQAKVVSLHIRRGVRFYYDELAIEGLHVIPLKRAQQFFINTDALFNLKRMRIYTPALLRRSLSNLREALNRRGYEDATVEAAQLDINSATGAVRLQVAVNEGLPSTVREVTVQTYSADGQQVVQERVVAPGVPYSRLWGQDFLQSLRTNQYQRGFPDTTAELAVLERETNATQIHIDLRASVYPGTNVQVGAVRYEGQHRTRRSLLQRFSRIHPGEPLNRIEVERARERLSRLGIFESVGLRYDLTDPDTRDVVFELRERKAFEVSLLFGYGSYDRLGAGVEVVQRNIFGRAHQANLKAAQTFKSSVVDYRYTVPELFGERLDVFFTGSLLRREEITFTREEYGGAVGVHRFFEPYKLDVSLRYDYQFLNARSAQFGVVEEIGVGDAKAAAFILELKHDRLDNPLSPRRGYKLFSNIELASDALGGDVSYQRFQMGGSGHWDLGGGRLVHVGATHGVTFTWLGAPRELPFNRRFFPGGENSIRGFQYGEAAPRDASGRLLGAENYLQGNAEFEQFLTRSLSLVGFVDTVGLAERRRDYPFDELLYSVGGGLRWKTVIGPVRLEYGHNLNRREFDPSGTLHFSFGFPF